MSILPLITIFSDKIDNFIPTYKFGGACHFSLSSDKLSFNLKYLFQYYISMPPDEDKIKAHCLWNFPSPQNPSKRM